MITFTSQKIQHNYAFFPPGAPQQPPDNVKKCKNFLSTLMKLAQSQPQQTVKNVRELIQGLIVR